MTEPEIKSLLGRYVRLLERIVDGGSKRLKGVTGGMPKYYTFLDGGIIHLLRNFQYRNPGEFVV